MGNTTSPRDIVVTLLNPNNIHLECSKAISRSPICFYVDIYKRSTELLGSTKILLTSNPLIPSVRTKVSSCGCSTRLQFTGVIISSIRHAPPLGKLCWMKLTCSLTKVACNILCLFRLELYFSSTGPS